jgi:hypothetical protein
LKFELPYKGDCKAHLPQINISLGRVSPITHFLDGLNFYKI